MIQRLKWITIVLLLTSFICSESLQVYSEGEYLIVRIVNAEYPPDVRVNPGYTFFEITADLEIENPTQSTIRVNYNSAPQPFPQMEIVLENKSLAVEPAIFITGISSYSDLYPGITEKSSLLGFAIEYYENRQLPKGEYTFWFNYTICCTVTFPVIIEKLHITITENNITYFYEYNNSTETFNLPTPTPTPTPTTTVNETGVILITPIILLIIAKRRKKLLK